MNRMAPSGAAVIVLALVLTGAVFLPALRAAFIWDDLHNVVDNPAFRGLSASHLKWMFTTFHDANYHPLVWLSLALDFLAWGMDPRGFHLSNLLLHLANTALLVLLLLRLMPMVDQDRYRSGSGRLMSAAAVGALFWSIHPLRVETVAWISTRGDLLCALFLMGSVLCYLESVTGRRIGSRRKWMLLALLAFGASLLSRAWGMTFPVVLLILDAYPLRRFRLDRIRTMENRKLLLEKVPFLVMAAGSAVLAIAAKSGSAVSLAHHGLAGRLVQAIQGLCFYPAKLLAPVGLSPLYRLDADPTLFSLPALASLTVLVLVTVPLALRVRQWPWAAAAVLAYATIISPLLGLVQSGPQAVADRYSYLSTIPFALMAAGAAGRALAVRAVGWKGPAIRGGMMVMATLAFAGFAAASIAQLRIWTDPLSFWDRVIQLDPQNAIAHTNRGNYFKDVAGDTVRALADYDRAIGLHPGFAPAYYNRGQLMDRMGNRRAAMADYSTVIRLDPKNDKAYTNRGELRLQAGDRDGALSDLQAAIDLNPTSPEAYGSRGLLYWEQHRGAAALADLQRALELAPENWAFRKSAEALVRRIRSDLATGEEGSR